MQTDIEIIASEKIESELREGMALAKCRKCGCMKETLEILEKALPNVASGSTKDIAKYLKAWKSEMEPIQYACLGCQYCFPAVATNLFNQAYPEAAADELSCAFEVKERVWPPVAGEYKVLCKNGSCSVAISTLGSPELADKVAAAHPKEVCIVGKTETENIGIDKVIKNTITNRTIRFLILAGSDPKGHLPGQTIMSLSANGVDEKMRVKGSNGKRPILRNVTPPEIESFRKQVQVVDMIGCEDVDTIVERIKELSLEPEAHPRQPSQLNEGGLEPSAKQTVDDSTRRADKSAEVHKLFCGCAACDDTNTIAEIADVQTVEAKEPTRIQMDKAGYFVVLPQSEKQRIVVEHYAYDNTLLHIIEGKDALSIYWTIIDSGWVTLLTHSAYLGKELEKAELSIKLGFKYVQDGA